MNRTPPNKKAKPGSDARLFTLRGLLLRVALLAPGAAGVSWFAMAGDEPTTLHEAAVFVGGACLVAGAFLLGYWLLMLVLQPRLPVVGVARAVVTEAIRMNVSIAFLVAMVLILAMIPLVVTGDDPLEYRIQQFLGYTLGLRLFPPSPMLVLSLLTILLACWTLSQEIEHKQIFTIMTKPIDRGRYLLGKWLGIVSLNAVLVAVVGLAVYGFVTLYMVNLPATDALDRQNVTDKVLTARVGAQPSPPQEVLDRIDQRVERIIAERGQAYVIERGGEAELRREVRQQVLSAFRSLAPLGRANDRAVYVFDGLGQADAFGRTVQLEYKLRGAVGDQQRVLFVAAGRPLTREPQQAALNIRQTLLVPVEAIEDGQLRIGVINFDRERSLTFVADEGLRLMYRVDDFASNFIRALVVIWIKLAFLAGLGLLMAAFLGFPVAALASMLVFVGAWASGFLTDAIVYYDRHGGPAMTVLKWIAQAITFTLQQYGRYEPATALVEGRYIAWRTLGDCALWIGAVWTGVTVMVGWLIFRRRELARVQV